MLSEEAMSIIVVEDGTGIANANAYATAATVRAYATLRGVTLPDAGTGIDPVETLLINAMDYMESLRYIGVKASQTQALSWPRVLLYPFENYPFYTYDILNYQETFDPSYYVMPTKLVAALCQVVIEMNNGILPLPTTPGGTQFVTREKVDVIETVYSERLGTLATPTMMLVNALLRGLVIVGNGSRIQTVRV